VWFGFVSFQLLVAAIRPLVAPCVAGQLPAHHHSSSVFIMQSSTPVTALYLCVWTGFAQSSWAYLFGKALSWTQLSNSVLGKGQKLGQCRECICWLVDAAATGWGDCVHSPPELLLLLLLLWQLWALSWLLCCGRTTV
jgi:hypothetical protein